jgi:hypothetical protein
VDARRDCFRTSARVPTALPPACPAQVPLPPPRHARTLGLVAGLLGLVLDTVAHAQPAPATPPAIADAVDGLVADVERIVSAQESGSWFVDESAYRDMYEDLMESVCRATPAARQAARAELLRRSQAVGDPRALYFSAGRRRTSAVDDALIQERQLTALDHALKGVERDCPFWVDPDPEFVGRQTDRDRFTLSVETGGMAQIRQTAGTWTLGGGGVARILPGYGFGGDISVLAGIEFGGGAMLRPNTEPTEFVINYFPAIPLLLRVHDVAWHYDFELAPVALFQADEGELSFGGRVGFATGVFALRIRGVLPWAGAAIAYEHYVPSGDRPRAHFIRGGLRVGVVWDP